MDGSVSDQLEFHTLHDAHPLRIEAVAGRTRRLVVSFTSVGTERGEWPPKEFISMASQRGRNHVICVTDISRSWMNADGMDRKITTEISDYVLANGISSIMAIGTSMGAFNALLLGTLMRVDRIVALAPQYSVHPDVMPDEKRWKWFRNQIKTWAHKSMEKLPAEPTSIFMFHGDTDDEQMHWSRFGDAENLRHYIFGGADHNFVRNMKQDKHLNRVVRVALNNRPDRLRKSVRRLGGMRRADYAGYAAAKSYFEGRRKLGRPAALSA